MYCPYCAREELVPQKQDYHHKDRVAQTPYNTFLTVLYVCPACGVTVEATQQVRITNVKKK